MKKLPMLTMASAFIVTAAAQAQNVAPEPPQLDQSRVARASEVAHTDFVDPTGETATRFAKERGISVAEATSQLRRQAALNIFIARVKSRHPDKFSFVSVAGDQITVGLTDPSIDLQSMLPAGLTNVKAVRAVYSEPDTHAKLEELKRQLSAAGLADVSVGVNAATGRIEFLTKSGRAALENAIKSGSIKVEHGYEIVDDEIIASGAL